MILATLAVLLTIAAILAVTAASAPRPQPLRARRQPTRAELYAELRRQRDLY